MSVPAVGPVDQAAAPQAATSRSEAQAAHAAKAFERVMLEQLTKELASSAAPEDGADGATAATKAYRDMLPSAMADALSQSGGIGIAAQLQAAVTGQLPSAATPSAGTPGASASAASPAGGGASTGGSAPAPVAS